MAQAAKQNRASLGEKIKRFSRTVAFNNPLYSAMLNGDAPSHLAQTPRDSWPGDIAIAQSMLRGQFPIGGKDYPIIVQQGGFSIWETIMPQSGLAELHGFRWLRHLHAMGGNSGRQFARQLIEDWISRYNQWDEFIWSAPIIAERLTAWLSQYAFFGISADDHFRSHFFQCLMRQLRHLLRIYDECKNHHEYLQSLKGLLYAAYALGDEYLDMDAVVAEIQNFCHDHIMADGCFDGRAPHLQAEILQHLIEIRGIFTHGNRAIPDGMNETIAAMARAMRTMRHGDGGLSLFHGSDKNDADFLDLLLVTANVKGRAADILDDGGWYRLNSGRSLIIIDGGSHRSGYDGWHNAPLAFEFSSGRERIIVNCGSGQSISSQWAAAAKLTAAHSTVDIENFSPDPNYHVVCERKSGDGLWFSGRHNGFAACGIEHQRRIFMNGDGDDIRGEDILTRNSDGVFAPIPFSIRFHLHPKIQSIEAQNSVILRTPSGAGWRLRASGCHMHLAPSVFLGQKGVIQRAKQIICQGELIGGDAHVKWAFQKEGKK